MRVGLLLWTDQPIGQLVAWAKRAEEDGFTSVWLPHIGGLDALVAAAVVGRETERIEVGTGVVPVYGRHPLALAQAALTGRVCCGGRFTLGIGLSHQRVVEGAYGLSFDRPVAYLRSYLGALQPLLLERRFAGTSGPFHLDATLRVPDATPCPLVLAALGPKMLELAGEVADGTITWMVGPQTLHEHVVPTLRAAAASAGRPPPRVVALFPMAVTSQGDAARESAARVFEVYGTLASYRAMLDREGVRGPEDNALIGTDDVLSEHLDGLAAIGVTDFVAVPFPVGPDDPEATRRTREFLRAYAAKAIADRPN